MTNYAAKACGCSTDQALQLSQFDLAIVDAKRRTTEKSTGTTTHIVYTIRFQGKDAKRRYRDFDSFRTALTQLYPDVLVPPIPEKHSLTDYAHARDKKDDALVEKRKRMLLRFLMHLATHPRLRHEHVFHLFLDGNVPWSEVLNSSPISTLSKEGDGAKHLLGRAAGSLLPHAPLQVSKEPDPQFAELETVVEAHAQFATSKLDRTQHRLSRRLGEISMDYSELGNVYEALSLRESEQVASDIKKIALATNSTQSSMAQLVHSLEIDFMEHMYEYVQYTQSAKEILRYRRSKRAQLELIRSTLESKNAALESLLKTQDHALQLEAALNSGQESSTAPPQLAQTSVDSDIDTRSIEDDFAAIDIPDKSSSNGDAGSDQIPEYPTGASAFAIRASRDRYKKWASPRKLLNAMSSTLQGMIDTDPEATRRNQIRKLKRRVAELQSDLTTTEQELEIVSENIQHELNDFKRKRTVELRAMMIAYAKIHLQYCEENARTWQDAKQNLALP